MIPSHDGILLFLWLNNVPPGTCPMISLCIHPWMDTWLVLGWDVVNGAVMNMGHSTFPWGCVPCCGLGNDWGVPQSPWEWIKDRASHSAQIGIRGEEGVLGWAQRGLWSGVAAGVVGLPSAFRNLHAADARDCGPHTMPAACSPSPAPLPPRQTWGGCSVTPT